MKTNPTISVLETINAPHREYLQAPQLAACLKDIEKSKAWAGHMSSFFGDVTPELQRSFAVANGIDGKTLIAAARAFSAWSGQAYEIVA